MVETVCSSLLHVGLVVICTHYRDVGVRKVVRDGSQETAPLSACSSRESCMPEQGRRREDDETRRTWSLGTPGPFQGLGGL